MFLRTIFWKDLVRTLAPSPAVPGSFPAASGKAPGNYRAASPQPALSVLRRRTASGEAMYILASDIVG